MALNDQAQFSLWSSRTGSNEYFLVQVVKKQVGAFFND